MAIDEIPDPAALRDPDGRGPDVRDPGEHEQDGREPEQHELFAAGEPAATVAPPPKMRRETLLAKVLPPLLLGSVVIGVWYFISYGVLAKRRRFLLEPPQRVLQVGFLDWDHLHEMLDGLWSSTKVALIGLILAIILGISVAVLMSQARSIERAVFPFMVMLQAVPLLAIVPLISFWWGTGQESRIIVCVLISLFPIVVNTLFGLQSAEKGMHDLFTLEHASRWTRLTKLMFPAALPAMFAGLRISAGLSVIGAIVGDFFFGQGQAGIGQLLRKYASRLQGEQLLAAVIISSALGVTVFLLFGSLQTRAIGKWHNAGGDRSAR